MHQLEAVLNRAIAPPVGHGEVVRARVLGSGVWGGEGIGSLSGRLAKEHEIATDLHALYEGFVEVLDGIHDDKFGTEFFAFQSWRLIDYFTFVSFFMAATRAELLKSLNLLRLSMAVMRDLASEQAETEGTLPYWFDQTPALYQRSAIYKRLSKWDWNRMAKYAPASFANMHAMPPMQSGTQLKVSLKRYYCAVLLFMFAGNLLDRACMDLCKYKAALLSGAIAASRWAMPKCAADLLPRLVLDPPDSVQSSLIARARLTARLRG
ncbi:hypothetical protein BC828DRAFT_404025 [Blastocladiella britannica]|nr:hypothetical protein BC828DRAFT_404025 [Blastocladiella britannica]